MNEQYFSIFIILRISSFEKSSSSESSLLKWAKGPKGRSLLRFSLLIGGAMRSIYGTIVRVEAESFAEETSGVIGEKEEKVVARIASIELVGRGKVGG